MKWILLGVPLVAALLAGCGNAPDKATEGLSIASTDSNVTSPHFTDSDGLIREKGKAVVQEAFSLLSSNLMAALATGGPSNAIPFCSVKALPLTQSVSEDYRVNVRRVSQRWRNPANAPSPQENLVLDGFQSQLGSGRTPVPVVRRTDSEALFYAPIVINNPLCLTCHGESGSDVSPETAALLKSLYPEDRATGFKLNDLRGMWVVEIPAEMSAQ